jgi:hypothetical protein
MPDVPREPWLRHEWRWIKVVLVSAMVAFISTGGAGLYFYLAHQKWDQDIAIALLATWGVFFACAITFIPLIPRMREESRAERRKKPPLTKWGGLNN